MDERHCMSACPSTGACQKSSSGARVPRRQRRRCLVRSSSRPTKLGCVRSLADGILECPAPRLVAQETLQQPESRAEDVHNVCPAASNSSGSLPNSATQKPGTELSAFVTPGPKRPIVEFTSTGGGPDGHAPWMQVYRSGGQDRHHGQPVYISQDGAFVLYYWDMGAERGWWLGRKEDGVAAENTLAYLPPGDTLWWAFQDGKPCRLQVGLAEPEEASAGDPEPLCTDAANDSVADHSRGSGLHGGHTFQRILDTKERGEPLGAIVLQRSRRATETSVAEVAQPGTNEPEATVHMVRAPVAKKPRTCHSQSTNLVLSAHGALGKASFLDAKSAARQDTFLQQLAEEGVLVEDDKAVFARLAREVLRSSIGGMPSAPAQPTRSVGFGGATRGRLLRI